jgi:hypothetical protein
LLARVGAHGFIDDYQVVRIAKDGARLRQTAEKLPSVRLPSRQGAP